MPSFSQDTETERSLQHSLKDARAFAVMTGIGETYLSAFALFLRATTPQIGLLASLPPLFASMVQLLSAWLGQTTGHRKRIIITGATIQAFAWLLIIVLPLIFSTYAVPLLIAGVFVYHAGAHLSAPLWSSLMGDIVPVKRRGRFFSFRTQLTAVTTFAALILGGIILDFMTRREMTLIGFVTLFLTAATARAVSVYHLSKMQDTVERAAPLQLPVSREWFQRVLQSNAARFSIFFAMLQFSVAIASPFFTVYMLRDLEFSYLQFMFCTGTAIFTQFLTLSQWGKISDVFGNRRVMTVTGLFIPIMPIMWTVSANFWYLISMQVLSGFCWAGFTLAATNFVYDLISPQRRSTYLAVHNVLANIGIFCGAILGGYLGYIMPSEVTIFGKTYHWLSPLYGVFAISFVARAIVILLLLPKLSEVRIVRPISTAQVIFRVTRIHALAGLFFDIVGTRPRNDRKQD